MQLERQRQPWIVACGPGGFEDEASGGTQGDCVALPLLVVPTFRTTTEMTLSFFSPRCESHTNTDVSHFFREG